MYSFRSSLALIKLNNRVNQLRKSTIRKGRSIIRRPKSRQLRVLKRVKSMKHRKKWRPLILRMNIKRRLPLLRKTNKLKRNPKKH